ncbi:MAG: hypothetical protein RR234_04680 [Christensenella sp.]
MLKMKKVDEVALLAKNTALKAQRNVSNWLDLCKTMGNNYKYPFDEQVLIYAQIPNATACATINQWNALHRHVNAGSKAVYLLSKGGSALSTVYDISQTNVSDEERKMYLWTMRDEFQDKVITCLKGGFGEFDAQSDFTSSIYNCAENLLSDNYLDYAKKFNILSSSTVSNMKKRTETFMEIAHVSIAAVILSRLGYNPHVLSSFFQNQTKWNNSLSEIYILGETISDIAKPALLLIAETIKYEEKQILIHERDANYGRGNEQGYGNERGRRHSVDLQTGGGLFGAEYRTTDASQREPLGNKAFDIHEGARRQHVYDNVDRRHLERLSGEHRPRGNRNGGNLNEANDEGSWSNGAAEGNRPNALGWNDEQHQKLSEGNNSKRPNIHLTIDDEETGSANALPIPFKKDKISDDIKPLPVAASKQMSFFDFGNKRLNPLLEEALRDAKDNIDSKEELATLIDTATEEQPLQAGLRTDATPKTLAPQKQNDKHISFTPLHAEIKNVKANKTKKSLFIALS